MKAWENGGLSSVVAGGKGNRGDHSEAPFPRQLLRLSVEPSTRHATWKALSGELGTEGRRGEP